MIKLGGWLTVHSHRLLIACVGDRSSSNIMAVGVAAAACVAGALGIAAMLMARCACHGVEFGALMVMAS